MSVTMVHPNPALVASDRLRIDRKFHLGMLNYARNIRQRITSVHPLLRSGQPIMDAIEVPIAELPYAVMTLEADAAYRLLPCEVPRMRDQIAGSSLVYGAGMGCEAIARRLAVPYIMVLEYDLQTQLAIGSCEVGGRSRRALRWARIVWCYATDSLTQVRGAYAVHCNGYPIYQALRRHNSRRLLYLDSRMSAQMLIPSEVLAQRLGTRAGRPLRLLYFGRYERLKGVDDAVRVAVECLRRGLDVEMHCYGQGSWRARMAAIAGQFPERIHIHPAIPYPELIEIARSFDLFVCCHIQSDPSCSYLESFGAGLPIVGYANRMWSGLCQASGAGLMAPIGALDKIADRVQQLLGDEQLLRALSERARQFAAEHCFEAEFNKRVGAICAALEGDERPRPVAAGVAQCEPQAGSQRIKQSAQGRPIH